MSSTPPTSQPPVDVLRQHCWSRALDTFGTSYVFQARIRRPQLGLRLITYLGFAVPLAIGLLVLGFGVDSPGLKAALPYAGALLVLQGLLSAFAIVFGWQQRVDDGLLSSTENNRLFNAYKNLASLPPPDLEARVAVLDAQNQARTEVDLRQGVTDAEKRMGMRAALRQLGRACSGCGQVPSSMEPTNCGICGNYSRRLAL